MAGIDDIDEDYAPALSIPVYNPIIDNPIATWNGRKIECQSTEHSFLQKHIFAPDPYRKDCPSLKGRSTELFFNEDDLQSDDQESDFVFALAPFIERTDHTYASLEEFLTDKGFTLDSEQYAKVLACKSFFKQCAKTAKKCAKVVKKACKDTKEFLEDTKDFIVKHKTECLIGAAAIGAAIGIGLVIAGVISASSATTAIGGAAAATAAASADSSSSRRKEEEDLPPSSKGPDPEKERSFKMHPHRSSPLAVTSQGAPPSGNEVMHKLFGGHVNISPSPPFNLYPTNSGEKQKSDVPAAPPPTPRLPNLPPSASAVSKSDAGNIMNNLFGGLINASPKPSPSIYKKDITPKNDIALPIAPPVSNPALVVTSPSQGILSGIVDALKRGLETIGRGMSEQELLDPNSPLDLFHKENAEQPKSDRVVPPSPPFPESQVTETSPTLQNMLSSFGETLKRSIETIGRGMSDPELLHPHLPVDFLQIQSTQPKSEIPEAMPSSTLALQNPALNEIAPLKSALSHFLETTGRNIETFSRSMTHPYLLTPVSPPSPIERSRLFKTEGINIEGICITIINGMNNTYEKGVSHAEYVRQFTPNLSIDGIYNHTNGPAIDMLEIFGLNYYGYSPGTADLLVQKWTEFFEKTKDKPSAKCLHFCYSQGAIHTKNALMKMPQEKRDKMIVIAIAPATVIPNELCKAFNYASKKDIVPLGEFAIGNFIAAFSCEEDRAEILQSLCENYEQLIWLDPHEDAKELFDHNFQSPTFERIIQDHIQGYFSHKGQSP